MASTRHNTRRILSSWRMPKLVFHYASLFGFRDNNRKALSEIEKIVEVMSRRTFEQRIEGYHLIQSVYRRVIREEDYFRAREFKQMLEHYRCHVLD